MREAAGQDIGDHNLLADSYAPYLAARKALLQRQLEQQDERARETGKFTPKNRFLLGAASGSPHSPTSSTTASDVMAPLPSCAPLGAANATSGGMQGSYMSWRRQLLAYRFEKRRAALTDELVKRLAAEAMQRALAAETSEKDSFDYLSKAANDARHAALRGEPLVWKCTQRYESALAREDEVVLSLRMGARSPDKRQRRGVDGGQLLGHRQRGAPGFGSGASSVAGTAFGAAGSSSTLWGSAPTAGTGSSLYAGAGRMPSLYDTTSAAAAADAAAATGLGLPGGRTITALQFSPKGNDTFAVATAAGVVYLCSAATGEKWATLTGHSGPIVAMEWSPPEARDGLFLLTVSADKTARIWQVSLPKVVQPPPSTVAPAGSRRGTGKPTVSVSGSASSGNLVGQQQASLDSTGRGDVTPSADAAGSSSPTAYHSLSSPPMSPDRPSSSSVNSGSSSRAVGGGGEGNGGSVGSNSNNTLTSPPAHVRRSAVSQSPRHSSRAFTSPQGGGGSMRSTSLPPPSSSSSPDKSAELERARLRMQEEEEQSRRAAEAAAGPRLEGGGAFCARIVQLEGALEVGASYYHNGASTDAGSVITHAAWCPSLPSMFVLAVAEEPDEASEDPSSAAAGGGGGDDPRSRRGSLAGSNASNADEGFDGAADRYGDDDVTGGAGSDVRGGSAGSANPFAQLKKGWNQSVDAVKQAGKATINVIEGGVGGAAKLTAAIAKAAGAGDLVTAPGTGAGGSGAGIDGGDGSSGSGTRDRRGAVMIIDSRTGRVVQTRAIKGSKLALTLPGVSGLARGAAAPMLTQSFSYATALCFSASGRQLYVSDGKGCLHEYQIEPDLADAQAKPLKSHSVIFGEGGNIFSAIVSELGGDSSFALTSAAAVNSAMAATPYLTSLFFRPYDAAYRCPVLIGLDNQRHARALLLPVQTSANTDYRPPPSAGESGRVAAGAAAMKVANAAKAGARLAVGAMEVVAKGAAAAAVVSAAAATGMNLQLNVGAMGLHNTPQASEVDFLHYVAQSASSSSAEYGGGLDVGLGSSSSVARPSGHMYSTSSSGAGLRGPTALQFGSTTGIGIGAAASSMAAGRLPSAHTALLPCRLNDGLLVGTAAGDVIVADPHTSPHDASNRTIGRAVGLGGLAVGGAAREHVTSAVSGIVPTQVVARLPCAATSAAAAAVAAASSTLGGTLGARQQALPPSPSSAVLFLSCNRDESVLVCADGAGGISAWRKVPISQADAMFDAAALAASASSSGAAASSASASAPTPVAVSGGFGLTSPVGIVTSARLAALFESQGQLRSVGRVAADEARALALSHIGGGGNGHPSNLPRGQGSVGARTGYAYGVASGGGAGSVGAGGGAASRRSLPSQWANGSGSGNGPASNAAGGGGGGSAPVQSGPTSSSHGHGGIRPIGGPPRH